MKKIIAIVLCIALLTGVVALFAGCNTVPREEQLKIYLPGEYMDYEIFEEFEAYYLEKTGKRVKVVPEEFETVEEVQRSVEDSQADYDLLCPSDYMIEYLIKKELLRELDSKVIKVSKDLFREEYVETTRQFDRDLKYAVPYLYGTLGLVYDISKTGKQIDSWEALYGTQYAGKRSVKDSIRDTYVSACLYNARSETVGLEGDALKAKIQSVFEDASTATVEAAEKLLKAVKADGSDWDVDDVKFDMAAAKSTAPTVALMWSCDAGYVMNDYEDAAGKTQKGNRNLWYVVPKEGGNVYIDAFVISKYAVNVEAANEFLAFLCRKDVAIANSEYAGAISPVKAAYDQLYEDYTTDDELFEGASDEWKAMFIETMFPSAETLNRCGVMKDFAPADYENISRMWSRLQ